MEQERERDAMKKQKELKMGNELRKNFDVERKQLNKDIDEQMNLREEVQKQLEAVGPEIRNYQNQVKELEDSRQHLEKQVSNLKKEAVEAQKADLAKRQSAIDLD